MKLLTRIAAVMAVASGICAAPAQASNFVPTKPVKIVVPFAVGSNSDIWSRVLAGELEKKWKQPVIVENKPGASGVIAARYVSRQQPDGHTLLAGSQSTAMAKVVQGDKLDFDPQQALAPVYKFVDYQMMVVANAGLGADSYQNLVDLSNKQEGGLFFGGYGATSVINTANNIVASGTGLKYTAVDFPGPAQILTSLVRGDSQYTINAPNSVQAQVDAGNVKFITAVSDKRYSTFPDVPSLGELGYTGYIPLIWNGLFTSGETPPDVLNAIAADLRELIANDEFRASLEPKISGSLQRESSPESFRTQLQAETKVWQGMFQTASAK